MRPALRAATNRGEAIGLVELGLPQAPDEEMVADVALAAHMLAYVIVANRRFTAVRVGERTVALSVAAEIQHRLLPRSYTCEGGQFTLAGWLEPAGNVGGDTFDFALERDTLHVSVRDAMGRHGHTVEAAVIATVLVSALAQRAARGVGEHELGVDARRPIDAALAAWISRMRASSLSSSMPRATAAGLPRCEGPSG